MVGVLGLVLVVSSGQRPAAFEHLKRPAAVEQRPPATEQRSNVRRQRPQHALQAPSQ